MRFLKDFFNQNRNNILSHLHVVSKALDDLSKRYDNVIFFGDFNVKPEETSMSNFLSTYHLKDIIIYLWQYRFVIYLYTCFKNPGRLTCIDLIMTNSSRSFKDICVIKMESQISTYWLLLSLNYTFPNKSLIFKSFETIKYSKIIYLDRTLIMSYQNLMYVN